MNSQRKVFVAVFYVLLCLVLMSACGSNTTLPPTATNIPFTATPSPTETPIQVFLASATIPMPQGYHRMAYDSESKKTILLNLQSNTGATLSPETWAFDFDTKTWEKRSNAPTNGEGPMAYDSQDDKAGLIIMFGGGKSKTIFTDETWAYDPVKGVWSLYQKP